jgi:large subunit ribosomal protein L21
MYAIVKTGGKQYRVKQGQSLLVERLPADDGASVELQPLLYVDGSDVLDGGDLDRVTVQARILAHERGPKLRIVKFKPKRGYKRRNGHRQELTRIEVTEITLSGDGNGGGGRASASAASALEAPEASVLEAPEASGGAPEASGGAPEASTEAPAAASAPVPASSSQDSTPEATDGT